MRGIDFIFDCACLLYYKCHKIKFKRGGSYIDSPDWTKNYKATINPTIKKDNKCFKNTVKVALNHKDIKGDPQRITKIKPFINRYNWEGIKYPSGKNDWKKIEKNKIHFKLGKYLTHHKYFQKKSKRYPSLRDFLMMSSYFLKFSEILMKS